MPLKRMANGWWRTPDPLLQIRFRKVEGRHLLLQRNASASGPTTLIAEEKAQATPISSRWRQRFGTYHADNAVKSVPRFLVPREVTLRRQDGLLVLVTDDDRHEVLQPIRKNVAFTFGSGPTMGRNKGDGVFAKGQTLTYMGVRYRLLGSLATNER